MTKIILIHGNGGSTCQDNWLPYVKKEMEKLGVPVIAQDFPDNILARASIWLPFLKDELKADQETIIVGHSSGAVAAMRFAETYPLLGSVLVGACYTDLGLESERLSGYYSKPWEWDRIRTNQKWIIQFASTDDPLIPIEEAHYIHQMLNTEYYESTDKGHFGGNIYMPEFKECITALKEKLNLKI